MSKAFTLSLVLAVFSFVLPEILDVWFEEKIEEQQNILSDNFTITTPPIGFEKLRKQIAFFDSLETHKKLDKYIKSYKQNPKLRLVGAPFNSSQELLAVYAKHRSFRKMAAKDSGRIARIAVTTMVAGGTTYKMSNSYTKNEYKSLLKKNAGLTEVTAEKLATKCEKISSNKYFKAGTISITAGSVGLYAINRFFPQIPTIFKIGLSIVIFMITYPSARYLQKRGVLQGE